MDWHGLSSCSSAQGQVEVRCKSCKRLQDSKKMQESFSIMGNYYCPEELCCTVLIE